MKYFIYGAGSVGKEYFFKLPKKAKEEIKAFCDNDTSKQGKNIYGKSILPVSEVANKGMLIIAMGGYGMMEAYSQLREVHPECPVGIIKHTAEMYKAENIKDCFFTVDTSKPLLEYVETDIVSHCNLKCRRCGHFADILAPYYVDAHVYDKDVARLSELYAGCTRFRIMGGEPLLHPDLVQIAASVRKWFPLANIRIVSNGILIPKLSIEALTKLGRLGIEFDITQYPPTAKMISSIKAVLDKAGLKYAISPLVDKFFDFADRKPADYIESYKHCLYPECHSMQNGYISVCGSGIFSERIAKMRGEDISIEEINRNRINIYDDSLTGNRLNEMLRMPIPACKWCGVDKPRLVKWERNV